MPKKVTIQYVIEESWDEQALRRTLNADNAYRALWEIGQEIFRPARKHGYSDQKLEAAMQNKELEHEEIVGMLEEKFYEILSENRISLEDDYN
jgi:hypothetical protein